MFDIGRWGTPVAARPLLIAICFLLAGCGFHPLYGNIGGTGKAATELGQVQIGNIPDRSGQMMRNFLIDKMYLEGRPVSPRYELAISLTETAVDLGIRKDATASRAQLNLVARYAMTDIDSGKRLVKGEAKSTVSYSKLDAQYANLVSSEDARARALREASDQIVNRLALYFEDRDETHP